MRRLFAIITLMLLAPGFVSAQEQKTSTPVSDGSLVVGTLADAFEEDERSGILKVYNWDDYIDDELIEEFESWYEECTGKEVTVMYQTFESDFQALNTIELGHDDWDVLTISTAYIAKAMKKGLFRRIDRSCLEVNGVEDWTAKVSPYFKVLFDEIKADTVSDIFDYVLPLSVGTTGMIYNKAVYQASDVDSWNILRNPDFKDRILLVGERDDVYSIATSAVYADSVAQGKLSVSELSGKIWHEDVLRAEQWLKGIRPQLAGWDTNFGYSYLIQERFPVLVSWNSNAISAIRESEEVNGPSFGYVIPKEGTYITCDCLVIPEYAVNVEAAVYWIDFMCRPENVIRNMAASNMISPVSDPLIFDAMCDEEKFPETIDVSYMFPDCDGSSHAHIDPTVYIDRNVLEKSFMVGDLSRNMEEISSMFSRIQSNEPSVAMIAFEILVVVLLVSAGVFSRWNHARRMKNYRKAVQRNLEK